ncbi:TPA: fumarylacetoacetate hydrolase family protein [Acinetobacter baumannii]|uniref:fumarylacetoacetate hydrolase family protein n=1 Tax=Acinetobacter TaxID=469 RepID=UPI00112A895E|nr:MULTISPECIES: fumarylacetoacetate hydrolase family protein [Acinetobacter]MCZ3127832.1 fumarylacetoacetate hydrolase family protein [Acinetobacter baumannii]MDC5293688.1 fumarylacetoacetate hydrolase family protein [Acinetobacter baumannii]TPT03764.1 fumarylacetoacetate hydrolase family protein [Acinetobacter baumannii]
MKLLTFRNAAGDNTVAKLNTDGTVQPLAYPDGRVVNDLLTLIKEDISLETLIDFGPAQTLESIKLLAPIPKPIRNIFCVGKNYINHAQEFTKSGFDAGQTAADAIPTDPIVFSKTPETVIAHKDRIWDAAGVSDALDYEAELAVVIGQGGRGINKADAMNHVWGYTIINDMTARDWQKRHKQWHLGKSFDTFGPMGPVVVTADEIDGHNLDLKCWVNDELRQNTNTKDLIFDIPTLIEAISSGITLLPGDIIATGTPEGVGIGFNPPRFLKRGDVVKIEISGIGQLENEVGA